MEHKPLSQGPVFASINLEPSMDTAPSNQCHFAPSDDPCGICSQYDAAKRRTLDAKTAFDHAVEVENQIKERMNTIHDPIHRLPAEVASLMFGFCIAPFPTLDGPETIFYGFWQFGPNRFFQYILGSVCRKWRQIVWSNPSFWSCLSLCFSSSNRAKEGTALLAKEWLDRSGQLPLVIRLHHWESSDLPSQASQTEAGLLMDAIISVAHRWSLVYLHLPAWYLPNICIDTPQPYFHCLYLHIHEYSEADHRIQLFRESRLARIEVHGIPMRALELRWDSITHFYQGSFKPNECYEVLRRSPSLLHVSLEGASDPECPFTPIIHPSIQYLEFGESWNQIFEVISLPALQELRFRGDCIGLGEETVEFIRRSQCDLITASFCEPTRRDALVYFLKAIPSLEHVEWIHCDRYLEASILKHLGLTADVPATSEQFLPNLKNLTITPKSGFCWSPLASIASPKPAEAGIVRRPLNMITVNLGGKDPDWDSEEESEGEDLETDDSDLENGDLDLAKDAPQKHCLENNDATEKNDLKNDAPENDDLWQERIDPESLRRIIQLVDSGMDILVRNPQEQNMIHRWIEYYASKGGEFEWLKPHCLEKET